MDQNGLIPGTYDLQQVWDPKKGRSGGYRKNFICRACSAERDRPTRMAEHMAAHHPNAGQGNQGSSYNAPSAPAASSSASPVAGPASTPAAAFSTPTRVSSASSPLASQSSQASQSPTAYHAYGTKTVPQSSLGAQQSASSPETALPRDRMQSDNDSIDSLRTEVAYLRSVLDQERSDHGREIQRLKQKHAMEMQTQEGMHKAVEEGLAQEIVKLKHKLGV